MQLQYKLVNYRNTEQITNYWIFKRIKFIRELLLLLTVIEVNYNYQKN